MKIIFAKHWKKYFKIVNLKCTFSFKKYATLHYWSYRNQIFTGFKVSNSTIYCVNNATVLNFRYLSFYASDNEMCIKGIKIFL